MHVLLIKTSSMGDIIHTLPALTDACAAIQNIHFDWVIEEQFKEIPTWHPGVYTIIPIAWRRWRRHLYSPSTWRALIQSIQQLKKKHYDIILDAQGLLKSALFTYMAKGIRCGLDWYSSREKLATYCYQQHYSIDPLQHAIVRMRHLFSQVLQYSISPHSFPDYHIIHNISSPDNFLLTNEERSNPYLVFLHGTSWSIKQWPEIYWIELAQLANQAGYRVKIGGGNAHEISRAKRITQASSAIDLFTGYSLTQVAQLLSQARAVVAVDTGLAHLATALHIPTITLYGPTSPIYTGTVGPPHQTQHLSVTFPCSPCLKRYCECSRKSILQTIPPCWNTLSPTIVWQSVRRLLE